MEYPQFSRLLSLIGECHQLSKFAVEPHCLLIKGESGVGKSTLIRRYVERYPRYRHRCGARVPVFYSSLPAIATIKGVVAKLISDLGDPLATRGSTVQQTNRFAHLMRECKVELLILDEFQHLVDARSPKKLSNVADWLKSLINDTHIPVILLGMPWCSDLLRQNPQLQRRFMATEELKAFSWGDTPSSQEEYRLFLATTDKQLPFGERSFLADREIAYRFYCATRGNVGATMSIIRWACRLALFEGGTSCRDYLGRGFERQYGRALGEHMNPFYCSVDELQTTLGSTPCSNRGLKGVLTT